MRKAVPVRLVRIKSHVLRCVYFCGSSGSGRELWGLDGVGSG